MSEPTFFCLMERSGQVNRNYLLPYSHTTKLNRYGIDIDQERHRSFVYCLSVWEYILSNKYSPSIEPDFTGIIQHIGEPSGPLSYVHWSKSEIYTFLKENPGIFDVMLSNIQWCQRLNQPQNELSECLNLEQSYYEYLYSSGLSGQKFTSLWNAVQGLEVPGNEVGLVQAIVLKKTRLFRNPKTLETYPVSCADQYSKLIEFYQMGGNSTPKTLS